MTDDLLDPVRRTAELITADAANPAADADNLERRLKQDIFNSISRLKPKLVADVDFDRDVLPGAFFAELPTPLMGIAIARCEGALAFYNRVGWHPSFLSETLHNCVPEDHHETFQTSFHASTLHDLAYMLPKHFEKILGKADAAALWETLKRHVAQASQQTT